ncbi:MAG: long-chain fatty acid--CoA ligase [Clostridiaceae bacterium]|nr:long-chain fatty acid--CoA ligase [Clostridiaceae bacterium]
MHKPFADQSILDSAFRETMSIPDKTMADLFFEAAEARPHSPAIRFMDACISFQELSTRIETCKEALEAIGVKKGCVLSICLPNIPEAVIVFYAINQLGAICNMIHPLAPPAGVIHHIQQTKSEVLFIPDLFLQRLAKPLEEAFVEMPLRKIVVIPLMTSANRITRWLYQMTKGRASKRYMPSNTRWFMWSHLLLCARTKTKKIQNEQDQIAMPKNNLDNIADRVSVYLHSGGTTGKSKIIELTDRNFNAIACQITFAIGIPPESDYTTGHSMVTVLPLFHGFGLCIGMHSMLANACCCILVPRFSTKSIARVIRRHRPTLMAGVPTLYEALLNADEMKDIDLSCFVAFFCGGDSLSPDLKKRFDSFLEERGSHCRLREGYGLTETVTVCSLTHEVSADRSGIGVPLTNMKMKIIDPETRETLPDGQTGEICVTGPQMMKGYLNDPVSTAEALVYHEDGMIWVETGDLGYRDPDGFYHFRGRIKRMIKVSGIPVFPAEIEAIISELPDVLQSAVIGISHPYKMQVVKAFVRVREGCDHDAIKDEIRTAVGSRLLRYAVPQEIEFVEHFPLTNIGKIDIMALEAQELTKLKE